MFGLPLIAVEVGGFVIALIVICLIAFVYGWITRARA